ncbi:ArsR/SmtB family transcription factor [Devosia sp.]|uniref:ArsR/SmtB family transcription factor n=1 Tax=Devosia sp. TaxID=1871048 RepID=UPI0035B1FDE3
MDMTCGVQITQAERAEHLLKAMAHAQRLAVLCCLTEGEHSSTAIARRSGMRLPAVSHHLGILRNAGIVASRRSGRSIIHTIESPQATKVLEALRAA